MASPLMTRIAEDFTAAFPAAGPARAAARRRHALQALTAAGLPTQREENWRYANLRALERARFVPAARVGAASVAEQLLPPALDGFARYVFLDGTPLPGLSAAVDTGAARLSDLDSATAATGATDPRAVPADERFALLTAAFSTGDPLLEVAARGSARVELLFLASCDSAQGASYPRLQVQLGEAAQLQLVERHLGVAQQPSLVVSSVRAQLARGAQLTHYRLQDLNTHSTHVDTLAVRVAAAGRYDLHHVASGAQSARTTAAVHLDGRQASTSLSAAALGERQQVQDLYAQVTHHAREARTTQTFRGIAAGRARVACNGRIVVTAQAPQADSQQSLRGLLAGPEAEMDLRPQLEIHTDAVRCTHGATSGKLDDNMLFYLLSRGLDPDSAARLLKWAFLEDVVSQIEPPQLRRQVETQLIGTLGDEILKDLL
ncbi:MAG: SufD family Fe-S cluster assembly protein [Proteobacteria bacterium]|nr:SufD family Fe-S cluster assembly protein [Pseudomonadota bacterium]